MRLAIWLFVIPLLAGVGLQRVYHPAVPLRYKFNHLVLQLVARGYISRETLERVVPRAGTSYPDFDAQGVRSREGQISGGRVFRWYEVRGESSCDDVILWMHGGGFVLGHVWEEHIDQACKQLALATGCRVMNLEYKLATTHPLQEAYRDVEAALTALRDEPESLGDLGRPVGRIVLGGDSAGAALALWAAMEEESSKKERIDHLILVYPPLNTGIDLSDRYWLIPRNVVEFFRNEAIHHPEDARIPYDDIIEVDGAHATLIEGLPPVHLVSAGEDPLMPGIRRLEKRLNDAGVLQHHSHFPTSIHGFFTFGPSASDTVAAFRDIALHLRKTHAQ